MPDKQFFTDSEGIVIGDDVWGLYDVPEDDDPDYEAWCEEMEKQCGRSVTFGEDGATCEREDCDGNHRGPSPYGEGYVEWEGGGYCAGDPLPVWNLRFTM